ncbi:MAG: metallophosphatase family protein [Endomicrobia bacterium]|nr:metallophosphatase family protein [Endomicrobiia bacterium]MDW8056258.1 metallophosphoesterase family protein [Elusimicrobiota bacterium]
MKIAVISDIHSNYEAFISILDEIKKLKVDKIYCCGDLVGYGPDPNECVELIRKNNIVSVVGNHDAAVFGKADLNWFREEAKEALLINKELITPENISFIKSLEENIVINDVLIVHGSPLDNIFEYLFSINALHRNIRCMKERVCFCGHTHQPLVYFEKISLSTGEIVIPTEKKQIVIDDRYKYIINVGSVGQPRDGDNRACFAIVDLDNKTVTFHRVAYNISAVQQRMRSLYLPEFLIKRLEFGI